MPADSPRAYSLVPGGSGGTVVPVARHTTLLSPASVGTDHNDADSVSGAGSPERLRRRGASAAVHAHHGLGHSHSHSHSLRKANVRVLLRVFLLTVAFMVIEVIAALGSNSLALLGDAFHMLSDLAAVGVSLLAMWVSAWPRTPAVSFGYARAEVLGALLSSTILWIISLLLIQHSIARLAAPQIVNGPTVLVTSMLSCAVSVYKMHILKPESDDSINVRAVYIHALSDLMGSLGVMFSGAVNTLWRVPAFDPLVTMFFGAIIIVSATNLIYEAVLILLESAPPTIDMDSLASQFQMIPGVLSVHDLHVWRLSSDKLALIVHLVSDAPQSEVLQRAQPVLHDLPGLACASVQVEGPSMNLDQCQITSQTL